MKHDEFLAQVRHRACLATTEEAERATRATLQTLGERIEIDEVKDLVSQLPQELPLYMQAPTTGLAVSFSLDEFFLEVENEGEVPEIGEIVDVEE